MSPKKRVYDLAKEYGMSGQELAGKLRDLGFSKVKSHMTALDDFEVMEIQGRLEAYGIVSESAAQSSSDLGGGLVVKKKKRKRKKPEDEAPAAEPAEEPEPEPDAETAETAEPEAATAPQAVEAPAPEEAEAPASEPAAEAAETEAPRAEPAAEAEAPEAAEEEPEPAPEPAAAEAPAARAEEPAAEDAEEEPAAPRPRAKTKAKAKPEVEPDEEEASSEEDEDSTELVRPSAKRRTGKVVGFIDLSTVTRTPKRPESRRHTSKDDVAPNVQPTMGRSRQSAFQRGDHGNRHGLTAQQLREREASRFLRRNRPGGPGAGGRRGGGGPRTESFGSPFAGGSIKVEEPISIKKLAESLSVKGNQLLKTAFRLLGFGSVNINSPIDADTAVLLGQEFDVEVEVVQEVAAEEQLIAELAERRESVEDKELLLRPPTVAFLGHVDHGKTTLIDTIRSSGITEGEAGGITQHIGAYQITNKHGHTLTIIDTPGHQAFTAMRARGAKAVDIVVLVVAADDGVKPQTEEALNHAKAAGSPIVVALNKCDKPDANPEMVRNQLSGMGLTPEDWGGDTAMLPVSALKGDGLEELLERVFLESEVLELKCHPESSATGVVLEAEIQQGKGKIAHLLVQDGSLHRGDVILAGEGYGKVRSIHDDRGRVLDEAGPSRPVEVTGLNELPTVGDAFYVVDTLDRAAEVAEERARKNRQLSQIERAQISRENIFEAVAEQEKAAINLIVKSDVAGSIEVLKHQLEEMTHEEVAVRIVHSGVGQVVESDVDLAVTSGATILAFHVGTNTKARQSAERNGVEIRNYSVIYELLDDVRLLMEGTLSPEVSEEITGHVEIRRIFKSSKIGNIAGCYVLDGIINRNSRLRLLRDGNVVFTGEVATLRREKDEAKEVREGFECGIVLKNYNDIKEGDIIETFKLVETKRTI